MYSGHQPAYPPPPAAYAYPPPPPSIYAPPVPQYDPTQFRREFGLRLEGLTINSRPIIQNLTVFAHDYSRYADIVAQVLHAHIRRSPPWMKLPAFYLLDMISKNITEPYARYFAPFLTQLFLDTYATVDESTKSKMQELLFTWRTGGPGGGELFPGGVQVAIETGLWGPSTIAPNGQGGSGGISASQVISELEFTLSQKERQLAMNPYDGTLKNQINVLGQLRRLVETGVSQNELSQILNQLHSLMKSSAPAPPPPPPPQIVSPPSVNDLLSTLMKAGVVKPTTTPTENHSKPTSYADSILSIPVSLSTSGITKSNPKAHIEMFLYSSPQCKQCGCRFSSGLDDHLDMHFRQNRKAKEKENSRGFTRSWFVSLDDWLGRKKKEANSVEDKKGKEKELRAQYVVVPPGEESSMITCPICKEDIKTEFLEDEEEWAWRNAVKRDNRIYHATCHSEASSASSLQARFRSSLPKSRSATPEVSLKRKAGEDSHSETGTPPTKKLAV